MSPARAQPSVLDRPSTTPPRLAGHWLLGNAEGLRSDPLGTLMAAADAVIEIPAMTAMATPFLRIPNTLDLIS